MTGKGQELHIYAPSRKTIRRPHAVRTYIPQVGYVFSYFDMYERESTARYSTGNPRNKIENEPWKKSERNKIPDLSHAIFSRLIGTPCAGQNKLSNRRASFGLVRCPPPSRPIRHRFGPGKDFLPLCLREPRRAPRV